MSSRNQTGKLSVPGVYQLDSNRIFFLFTDPLDVLRQLVMPATTFAWMAILLTRDRPDHVSSLRCLPWVLVKSLPQSRKDPPDKATDR